MWRLLPCIPCCTATILLLQLLLPTAAHNCPQLLPRLLPTTAEDTVLLLLLLMMMVLCTCVTYIGFGVHISASVYRLPQTAVMAIGSSQVGGGPPPLLTSTAASSACRATHYTHAHTSEQQRVRDGGREGVAVSVPCGGCCPVSPVALPPY